MFVSFSSSRVGIHKKDIGYLADTNLGVVLLIVMVMMVGQLMMSVHHQRPVMAQVRVGIFVHPVMVVVVVRRSQGSAAQGHGSVEGAASGCLAGEQVLHLPFVSARKEVGKKISKRYREEE